MEVQVTNAFTLDAEPVILGVFGNPYVPPPPEFAHGLGLIPGSGPFGPTNFDMSSWPSTMDEFLAHAILPVSERAIALMGEMSQLEQNSANNNATNPTPTLATSTASPSSSGLVQEAPSNSQVVPIISFEHQTYPCSWRRDGLGAQCIHVAPNRQAFLCHLNEAHQVSGSQGTKIICRLLDSKTGSVCRKPIKRENATRHVDTHYRRRYNCQYCPETSFSRQDSWKKHMKEKHA